MSIESLLDRIATGVEALVAQRSLTLPAAIQADAPVMVTTIPAAETPRKRGRPKVETAPVLLAAGVDFGDSADGPSFLDEVETAPPVPVEVTLEDVRAALIALQKRKSPEVARSVLKKDGDCDSLKALAQAKFAAVIAAANNG